MKILKDSECSEFGGGGLEARACAGSARVGAESDRSPIPGASFLRTDKGAELTTPGSLRNQGATMPRRHLCLCSRIPSQVQVAIYHGRVPLLSCQNRASDRNKQHCLPITEQTSKGFAKASNNANSPHKKESFEILINPAISKTGEMAQLVKGLVCKYGDPSSEPQSEVSLET